MAAQQQQQSQAGKTTAKRVSVPSQNKAGPCPAVVFTPSKVMGGVVVLQEWWGLNQQIQDEAQELAERGNFVTIVPDLYRGKVTDDREEAGHFMGGLNWEGAVSDIQGCAQFLLAKAGCKKVGVTGFCMGGALCLASAVKVPELNAAAPFYGIPGDAYDVSSIKIPIQCHFGELDEVEGFSDKNSQEKLKGKLEKGKVNFKFFSYPGAKHAFTNKTSPNFNAEAFKTSFSRLVDFFSDSLK